MSAEKSERPKLEYSKPKLEVIELAADEVLGAGCKTETSVGFGMPGCHLYPCLSLGT